MTTLPAVALITLGSPFGHLFDRRTWRKAQLSWRCSAILAARRKRGRPHA